MAAKKKILKVLFLAAEADPFVKIGGLGDVAGSLPPVLRTSSMLRETNDGEIEYELDLRLVLPYHGEIHKQNFPIISVLKFRIPRNGDSIISEGLTLLHEGLTVHFIKDLLIPLDSPVYSGDELADGEKFVYFSMAALQFIQALNWRPDIIHANDWHTALAVYALKHKKWKNNFFLNTSTLIGVHNLPYYGPHVGSFLSDFDLPPGTGSALPIWAQDIPLALGLSSADHIVTVSPSYAEEMQTPEFGAGLDQFLRSRTKDITGILNGIDMDKWDPNKDTNLVKQYNSESLDDRVLNKIRLQGEIGFNSSERIPLIGMVTRLDHQKGVDLVPEALRQINEMLKFEDRKWQFILLGTGDPKLESEVRQFESEFQDRVKVVLQYNAALSHRIFSGADMLLIPSRYEPCGLTQMIAMRYGCIPIGRATGGLNDTIQDYTETEDSTGFLFSEAKPEYLAKTIATALHVFGDRNRWYAMQNRAMNMDFSWIKSARLYMQLYLDLHYRRFSERNNI